MNDTSTLPATSGAAQEPGAPMAGADHEAGEAQKPPMTGADVAVRAAGIGRGLVDPIPHLDIGTLPVLDPKKGVLPKSEDTVVPTQTDKFGVLSIVKQDIAGTPSTETDTVVPQDNAEPGARTEISMTAWPGADAEIADEPMNPEGMESTEEEPAVSVPEMPAEATPSSEPEASTDSVEISSKQPSEAWTPAAEAKEETTPTPEGTLAPASMTDLSVSTPEVTPAVPAAQTPPVTPPEAQ